MAFFSPAPVPVVGRAAMKRLAHQLSQTPPSSSSSPLAYYTQRYSTSAATGAASPFVCRQCMHATLSPRHPLSALASAARTQQQQQQLRRAAVPLARWLSDSASKRTTAPAAPTAGDKFTSGPQATSRDGARPGDDDKTKSKKKAFPEVTSKSVAYWLLGSAASVFGIVVLGGLTRLTESGLSITEWRPVTGSLPPLSPEDWESEFAKYRASPEYVKLNPNMDLDEFKKIYFMEWAHRLWGRVIGLTFVLPAAYFVYRRRVTPRLARHLAGIAALIGFQGAIGWWMVSSGLRDDLFAEGAHPRVSQYRLTTHLATAFVCYSWMLLAGLSVLRTHRLLADPAAAARLAARLAAPAVRPYRRAATALGAVIFATALTGALVAGLDAGLIYNEFPRMGLGLAPPAAELWDRFYCRRPDAADLWWRNMLENPSLVQLDHRVMATTVCASVLALFAWSRASPRLRAALPADARKATMGLLHLMVLQVTLGISTLIYMVPTHLAAAHQAGALALLTGALVLGSRLRIPKGTMQLVQRRLAAASKASSGPARPR